MAAAVPANSALGPPDAGIGSAAVAAEPAQRPRVRQGVQPQRQRRFVRTLHNHILFFTRHLMRKGTTVSWKYGTGTATGKIESVHKEPVVRTIKGAEIHRNGSAQDPAFVIVQANGSRVLKLKSEVKPGV